MYPRRRRYGTEQGAGDYVRPWAGVTGPRPARRTKSATHSLSLVTPLDAQNEFVARVAQERWATRQSISPRELTAALEAEGFLTRSGKPYQGPSLVQWTVRKLYQAGRPEHGHQVVCVCLPGGGRRAYGCETCRAVREQGADGFRYLHWCLCALCAAYRHERRLKDTAIPQGHVRQ